jgi:NAD(P)-dependent dehydrogenase (short-subunit alcohol dehydrogenase family)
MHISYGSPEEVAQRLATARVLPLATDLIVQFSPAAPALDEAIAALELLATQGVPALGWHPARQVEPAGPGSPRALADLVDADLLAAIDTKVLGYLRCARAVAPHMIARGWGRIINISGLAARSAGLPSGSIRNVAVAALTKNLADELGPAGINVTVVHPGMTVTERTPAVIASYAAAGGVTEAQAAAGMAAGISIGRIVTAAEVADVVTFLASPRSVAINGDAIAVGGGPPAPSITERRH